MADLSPDDRDWIIRTIAGEADPAGQAAVANVIKNRMQSGGFGGPTGKGVVMSPGQFSMWNRLTGYAHGAGANDVGTKLSPNSSTYQDIGKTVDNVFSGQTSDPTKGALNYYAPSSASPAWGPSMKNPVTIGSQVYGTAGPARPVTPTPGMTINTAAASADAPPPSPVSVGPGPGNVGPVTGFLPGQPTGQGGIGSDTVAGGTATTPASPSIASQVAGPLQALTKDLEDSGKGQQQGGAPDQSAQLQAQQAAAMGGIQRQQELRARAEQMMAALLAQGQRPLSWNSAPPGSGAGLQIMAQTPTPGGGYVGGTTLNSMGDAYG